MCRCRALSEWVSVTKFNGTSTPTGSYRAKTGDNDYNVNSSLCSLSTALCESIRYQAKSEQKSSTDASASMASEPSETSSKDRGSPPAPRGKYATRLARVIFPIYTKNISLHPRYPYIKILHFPRCSSPRIILFFIILLPRRRRK